jgi:glycosyltransferase involved in cell wall biosynthesis
MKIAIDVSQMCYEGTGVARYVHGLANALLAVNSPHTFLLYAGALRQRSFFTKLKSTTPWNKAEWKILPLPPKLAALSLNTLKVPVESLIGPVDLLHTSDWSEPSSKCPRVTTIHDLVFKKYPSTVDPLILSTQEKRLQKVVSTGTHVIADSKSTKIDLMETYQLPDERIDVVYPGINPDYKPQTQSEIDRVKNKYHLPDSYILSLGKNEPRKNLPRLIEACKELPHPLVLTGQPGWGEQIKAGGNVISTGYVDDQDLPALYSGALVFVYPSLYEGFGFPVLEAMACGTPVVTSNTSSLKEITGSAGILIDPLSIESIKQGILKALSKRDNYAKLGIGHAQQFTWEKAASAVMEVYEKIANRN